MMSWEFDANLEAAKGVCRNISTQVIENHLPKGVVLNVNIPSGVAELKGIKICRQADAKWIEEFDERQDPRGRKYYWLTGKFENFDKGESFFLFFH